MNSLQDEFSDDDEAAYRDDDNDLDLNFENFHMRHGNREIASSPEESAGKWKQKTNSKVRRSFLKQCFLRSSVDSIWWYTFI